MPLDETSGTTAVDISGQSNNGTLYNGPVWTTGAIGGGLRLDGTNDYLSRSSVQGLPSGNTPHTVAGWIKVNALPSNRAWIALLGSAGTGSHHWLINSSGGTAFGAWAGGQVSPSLPVGVWKHVAITFDGVTLTGYVDGVAFNSKPATFNLQGGNPLSIGKMILSGENYFNGVVDDMRVYDRALDAAEVAALAANQPPAVSISAPASGSSFNYPANITLTANATDSDGSIAKVEYYNGATLIGSATTAPYGVSWSPSLIGNYTLKARAIDNLGTSTLSSSVAVTIAKSPSAPVLTWALDEGSNTVARDTSGFANDGTLSNGPVWTGGRIGSAVAFDGVNDYLYRTSIQGLPTGNTPHTIAAWVKVNALPSGRAWILLLGNEATGAHHWTLGSTGGTGFGAWAGPQVSPALPVGQWKHVAITFNGSTVTGYVNGTVIGTARQLQSAGHAIDDCPGAPGREILQRRGRRRAHLRPRLECRRSSGNCRRRQCPAHRQPDLTCQRQHLLRAGIGHLERRRRGQR